MPTQIRNDTPSTRPATRNGTRKFVLWLAIGCFVASTISAGLLVWALVTLGVTHVASASMLATTLFLASCGVVMYFMSLPPRPILPGEQTPGD